MTYTSGARSGQADPAADLYGLVAAQLTAHSNWTFIETWDASPARWNVWKCGTANSSGVAFYVLLGYLTTAGSTSLSFAVAEEYRTSDHSYNHPAPTPVNSNVTPAADSSWGGSTYYPLHTSINATANLWVHSLATSTTAFDYWIAVNNDGLFALTRLGASLYPVVLGTLDSLVRDPATNDPAPLAIATIGTQGFTSNQAYGSSTRHPRVTTAKTYLFGIGQPGSYSTSPAWPSLAVQGSAGAAGSGDLFLGGEPSGARLAVVTWGHNYLGSAPTGKVRGLWRHLIALAPASGVSVGDTVTVDGDTYVFTGIGPQSADAPWYNISAV